MSDEVNDQRQEHKATANRAPLNQDGLHVNATSIHPDSGQHNLRLRLNRHDRLRTALH